MSDADALARAAIQPMLDRVALIADNAINALDAAADELIARHGASVALTAGIEEEVARHRQALMAALLRSQKKLDAHFGGAALVVPPSPLDQKGST